MPEQEVAIEQPQVQLETSITAKFTYATEPANEQETLLRNQAQVDLNAAVDRVHKATRHMLIDTFDLVHKANQATSTTKK